MKLIADEGVDQPIVSALRTEGFEVTYYAETNSGSMDEDILSHAQNTHTLLLTCDKDFGELVHRNRMVTAGVLLIRLAGLSASKKSQLVIDAIRDHGSEMLGKFAVIAPGQLRIRQSQ